MFPRPVAASIAILALCLVACGGRHNSVSSQTPTGTPAPASPTLTPAPSTSTPPPTATLPPSTPDPDAPQLPLDTKTGIAAADHFLSLLASRDFATIAAEAVFPPQPCTTQLTGIPAKPHCAAGQSENDLTSSQIFASCEPNYLPPTSRSSLADRLETIFSIASTSGYGPPYLESVWHTIAFGATYAVVVVFPNPVPGHAAGEIMYIDAEGHFAGHTACGDYDVPVGNASRLFPP